MITVQIEFHIRRLHIGASKLTMLTGGTILWLEPGME